MTTERKVLFGNEAKVKLQKGSDILSNAVSTTLGAKGRNVVIAQHGMMPHVTKDGVTVARSIVPSDPIEAVGADLVRQAAIKTAMIAGDGTTTATVLAQSMINQGLQAIIEDGANPIIVKEGIEKGAREAVEMIKQYAKPIDNEQELLSVATISANNDAELGAVISDVANKVGKDGIIRVENSHTAQTYGKVIEGMTVDRGYLSPYFATNNRMEADYSAYGDNKVMIMVCDMELAGITPEFATFCEEIIVKRKCVLVIIAKDVIGEMLGTLTMWKQKNKLPVIAIKAPNTGDIQKAIMQDICAATGAKIVSDELGLPIKNILSENALGECERIVVDEVSTVIIGGAGTTEDIESRVETIKHQLSESSNDREKQLLKRRIANMKNGVGVVYVGALTEAELNEKKDRIDDAIGATKAAQEEGIIAGGGITMYDIGKQMQSTKSAFGNKGYTIVANALQQPMTVISENAGISDKWMHQHSYPEGMNVKTGLIVNMVESGIIDPAMVARAAIENAASVAALFLTTECVSYEEERSDK